MLSTRVKPEVQDKILMYMPEATPLLTLMTRAKKTRVVENPSFDWMTKDEYPREGELTVALAVGGTTLTMTAADVAKIAVNDLLRATSTGEVMRVTAIPTTTTVTVNRFDTPVPLAVGAKLHIMGNAYEDGATKGTFKSILETRATNNCHILRTPFGRTYRLDKTALYGGSDREVERLTQSIEHKKSMEYCMLFSKLSSESGTNHLITTMDGMDVNITSNRWDLGGISPTKADFIYYLEEAMRWGEGGNISGSGTKFLYHSSRWGSAIQSWFEHQIRTEPLTKDFGFAPASITTPHGKIVLLRAPILDYVDQDKAFLFDLNHIRYVHMKGYNTFLRTNIQDPSAATYEEEFYSDFSIQWDLEAAHGAIFGLPA
jgi:hypothetical protein